MRHCKHQWEDRTDILREVFRGEPERATHAFRVCARCLRIEESAVAEPRRMRARDADHAA